MMNNLTLAGIIIGGIGNLIGLFLIHLGNSNAAKQKNDNKRLSENLDSSKNTIISKFLGDENYGMVTVTGFDCDNQPCYTLDYRNLYDTPIYDVQILM